MGLPFAAACPESRETFAVANSALGFDLAGLIANGPAEMLAQTEHTQPAVLTASIAALRAAQAAGLPGADFVAGHSLGEYSALVAAGVLDLADAVRIVRDRGRFMQEAVPVGEGAMAAVLGLPEEKVAAACAEVAARTYRCVVAANLNAADQTVIAGHADAVQFAGEECRKSGARRVIALDVSAPFHSPLMAPVVPRLAAILNTTTFRDGRIPLVSNVEATSETSGAKLRGLLLKQVTAPVRWIDVVAKLVAEGCDTFIELGPGTVLGGLARRQATGARVFSIFSAAKLDEAQKTLLG